MSTTQQNAVLVGVQLPKITTQELEGSLQELSRLVKTLGYNVVGQVTQKRSSNRSTLILGRGKMRELAEWTGGPGEIASLVNRKLTKAEVRKREELAQNEEDLEPNEDDVGPEEDLEQGMLSDKQKGSAQIVIVDIDLSPAQIRNLESATGVKCLDRTGVIIEIFSRHARTRAARLQVEIARLQYVAPRLRETGGGSDDQGGGGRGASETKLELDRRKIRDRIKELKLELESVGNEHQVRRARREQELTVALVGYTNAGKSSLMRALTGSDVLIADKLFATLDTTIRPMYPETRPKVLISDTVGFIKKLPHDLVASFKSTLDEALNASLLLYVVDASDLAFRSQLAVTKSVIGEVGANDVESLLVFNKRDRLSTDEMSALKSEFPDSIFISTRNKDDIKMIQEKIMSYFETDMVDSELFIPYSVQGAIGEIRSKMRVTGENYTDQGVTLKVRATEETLDSVKRKLRI